MLYSQIHHTCFINKCLQALYATFCPLFIFRLQGSCWEKHWDERKDNVYFVLWGESVHYFFTLRSSGQLCPVFPRPKKLSGVSRGHQGDSPDFFLMSWSNKNNTKTTIFKRLFHKFITDFFKSLNNNIYERKNVNGMAESKIDNSFQTQERKISSILMIFINVFLDFYKYIYS